MVFAMASLVVHGIAAPVHAQPLQTESKSTAAKAEPAESQAQHPVDVPDVPATHGMDEQALAQTFPPLPKGYTSERHGTFLWEYPERATEVVQTLMGPAMETYRGLSRTLGQPLDEDPNLGAVDSDAPSLRIRVGRNPEHMRALAPQFAPPPEYADGVAYPPLGLIVLTLTSRGSGQRPHMPTLVAHELSHIALHRAVQGARVPRWFTEGVAVYTSGEARLERLQALWEGAWSDSLHPLSEIDRHFPARAHQVNLAYAQSSDFIAFLLRQPRGERKLRELIKRLREGEPFDRAFFESHDASLRTMEREWLTDLDKRYQSMPLWSLGGTALGLSSLLLVAGFIRAKRRNRARINAMGAREDEEQRALQRLAETLEQSIHDLQQGRLRAEVDQWADEFMVEPSNDLSDDEDAADGDAPLNQRAAAGPREERPRAERDTVPTVRFEGQDHTLH